MPEEDVKPEPNLPLQEIIIIDPDDQPMWENAKIVAPTPNSAIVQPNVDDNFLINSTHLKMIRENKFDGYPWVDPHDHIHEPTQAILDVTAGGVFLYKSPNQAFQFLDDKVLFELDWSNKLQMKPIQKSVAFSEGSNSNDDNSRFMEKLEALTIQFLNLKEELQDMRKKYDDLKDNHTSKNQMNDETPMCEHHEASYIESKGYQNRNSHYSLSRQSHYDPNDSEKSLTELTMM
ncbi:hypothetical protein Tco_0644930 [Tanacetum coccineum]